jgi:hypothetical protein
LVDGLGEAWMFGDSYLEFLFLMDKLKSLLKERSERASLGYLSLNSFALAFLSETSSFAVDRFLVFCEFKTFVPEVLLLSPTGILEDF